MRISKVSLVVLGIGLVLAGAGGAALVLSGGDDSGTADVTTTIESQSVGQPEEPDIEGFASYCRSNANLVEPGYNVDTPGLEEGPPECQDFYEWESESALPVSEYPGHIPPDYTTTADSPETETPGSESETECEPPEYYSQGQGCIPGNGIDSASDLP